MIHNNSNLIGAAAGKNAKLFRTMLDPVVRYVFARSDNPGPLRSFINSVFADSHEPPIKELKILHPFDPKTYQNEKQTIVDTLAEDEDHRKFFVEFQIWDHRYFIERGLCYWAHNYCDLLKEGEGNNRLYPVIGIFLTDFQNPEKFGFGTNCQAYPIHQSFSIRSDQDPERRLTSHLSLHFLQQPKAVSPAALEGLDPALADWMAYFGYPLKTPEEYMESIADGNPMVSTALNSYSAYHRNPELRMIAEGHERFIRDAAEP